MGRGIGALEASAEWLDARRRRRVFLGQAASVGLSTILPSAFAQSGKGIRLLALEVGAQSDMLARALQPGLSNALDTPVVVENYGGAGGKIAAQMALRSEPDGNTLLVGGANNMVMSPLLSNSAGYDPVRDFVVLAPIATAPFAVAASTQLGVTDLPSLIAAARTAKQPLSGGSAGVGGSAHVALEVLFHQLSLPLLHVPFRGTATASHEVVAGRLDLVVTDLPRLLPLARDGRLRILGVTGSRRSVLAPEIPTIAEQGAGGFRVEPWYALYCRTDVARSRADLLASTVQRISAEATYLSQLQRIGFERWNDTTDAVNVRMKQDRERVLALVASGLLRRE